MYRSKPKAQSNTTKGTFIPYKHMYDTTIPTFNEYDTDMTEYIVSETDDETQPVTQKNQYEIEKIVNFKCKDEKNLYKVKWKGYGRKECTWEKEENLRNNVFLIQEFEERLAKVTHRSEIFKLSVDPRDNNRVILNWKVNQRQPDSDFINDDKDLYVEDLKRYQPDLSDLSDDSNEIHNSKDDSESNVSKEDTFSSNNSKSDGSTDILAPAIKKEQVSKIKRVVRGAKIKVNNQPGIILNKTSKTMFFEGAVPLKIVSHRYFGRHHVKGMMADFLVKWRKPIGGSKRPRSSYYSNYQLRLVAPELLAEYYKCKFIEELEKHKKIGCSTSIKTGKEIAIRKSKNNDTKRILGLIPEVASKMLDAKHTGDSSNLIPFARNYNSLGSVSNGNSNSNALSNVSSTHLDQPVKRKRGRPRKVDKSLPAPIDMSKFSTGTTGGFAAYLKANATNEVQNNPNNRIILEED